MSLLALYFLLVKATLTSFSGLTSLPVIHRDLIVERHVLTERQLNAAVALSRATPGPLGLYVVGVGYFIRGVPGAAVGVLAMITPAFLIIPLLRWVNQSGSPRLQRAARTVTIAAAGLITSSAIPLARDALVSPGAIIVGIVSFALLAFTEVDTLWIVLAAAATGLIGLV